MSIDELSLSIVESDTQPMFRSACAVVKQWFPKSVALVVDNATHWLHITNHRDVAEVLSIFLGNKT
jgi:hypothetical protein